ncbi:MAG: serine/threonine-protein kinase [Bdellovibrionota bacterium]
MNSSKFKVHQFGKYVLLEEVASGGMAVVYKALGKTIDGKNHYFAIKRILPSYSADEEFISLLKDEAKLMVQLNHPNIVSLIEFGKVEEDYYIAMEYIEGTTLKGMIQKVLAMGNQFTIDMATHIIREIATGLSYAHRKMSEEGKSLDIVHRDISPANILVSYDGEVKITDFGISKASTQTHFTQSGIIRGKTGYMSPEQTRSDIVIDHRSDLFSLGVIFYELLTGKKLFYAKSIPEAIRLVREGHIPKITDSRPDIPKELEKIVFKLLEQKPENRYQRAEDLMDALNEFLTRFSPAGRPLRITHVDLIGFLRRFYPKEMAVGAKNDSEISNALQDAYETKPSGTQVAKQYEKSKTFASNPLYEVSVPMDNPRRLAHSVTEKALSGSITEAAVGEISIKRRGNSEVTEIERFGFMKHKHMKWIIGGGAALLIGIIIALFQGHQKSTYQSVKISSEPEGAQVWIDGVLQGSQTPGQFKIQKSKTTILIGIQKKGYQLVQQTRRVSDLTEAPIVFQLEQDRATAAMSKVLLNTDPQDVKVILNGNEVNGLTPIELQLEVGKTYQLRFEKSGFYPKETSLTVDVPGALQKTVSLTPMRKETQLAAETKVTPPVPLGSPGKKVVSPGSISVTSEPWAYVFMDNKKVGETPVVNFSTTPGKHILKLSNPDLGLEDKEFTVDIVENKHMKCSYDQAADQFDCQ